MHWRELERGGGSTSMKAAMAAPTTRRRDCSRYPPPDRTCRRPATSPRGSRDGAASPACCRHDPSARRTSRPRGRSRAREGACAGAGPCRGGRRAAAIRSFRSASRRRPRACGASSRSVPGRISRACDRQTAIQNVDHGGRPPRGSLKKRRVSCQLPGVNLDLALVAGWVGPTVGGGRPRLFVSRIRVYVQYPSPSRRR
jgi:hypothetical protein